MEGGLSGQPTEQSADIAIKMLLQHRHCVNFVHDNCGNAQRASRKLLISSVLSLA